MMIIETIIIEKPNGISGPDNQEAPGPLTINLGGGTGKCVTPSPSIRLLVYIAVI